MINAVAIAMVSQEQQRYDTVGDWQLEDGRLTIRVSEQGNWRSNMLIAVHELVEVILCVDKGVTQEQVDAFDMAFENATAKTEPGDDAKAPYRDQHCFATAVERMLCAAMGLSWADYEAAIDGEEKGQAAD